MLYLNRQILDGRGRSLIAALLLWVALLENSAKADPTESHSAEAVGIFAESSRADRPDALTGAFSHTVTFHLPTARGSAQAILSLVYDSGSLDGEAGYGWSLPLPSIQRSPLSGWPTYDDNTDRFTFSGRPLTFICIVPNSSCGGDPFPAWARGYRYYRQQVEDNFSRFFLSPDGKTWRVQEKGGTILELGSPLTHAPLGAEGVDRYGAPSTDGPIFRWRIVRQVDPRGNLVVYLWKVFETSGLSYLTDIYDTAPVNGALSIGRFAHHTQLLWEPHDFLWPRYAKIDKARPDQRLRGVSVASMNWEATGRRVVRQYRLNYYRSRSGLTASGQPEGPLFHHSFLHSIQMEGSCGSPPVDGDFGTNCAPLPGMTFNYEPGEISATVGGSPDIHGENGAQAAGRILTSINSASVIDIDRDGLPDVVETWPPSFLDVVDLNNYPQLRQHVGYLNGGVEPYHPHPFSLNLTHQCIDAGDATPGSLNFYQLNEPPAFLTSDSGASVIGHWADGILLWNKFLNYGPIGIERVDATPSFCPEATVDPKHGAWRWAPGSRAPWMHSSFVSGVNAPTQKWFVDVDGDGYADSLNSLGGVAGQDFERSGVLFTTQLPAGVQYGPALTPFTTFVVPAFGLVPAANPRPDTRYFYVDVNGDGLADLVSFNPNDNGGVPRVRSGDGRGNFACIDWKQPAPCSVPANPAFPWVSAAMEIDVPGVDRPWPLNDETFFHDITGDGLSDIVQIRIFKGVLNILLWINQDGITFRCANPLNHCSIGPVIDDWRGRADISPRRVTFADMDGNGTDDVVVLGNAGIWFLSAYNNALWALDPRHAPTPGLLTRIDNGYGATTLIDYQTIQALDHAANGESGWTHHVPTVVPVVTRIVTTDTPSANSSYGSTLPSPYGFRRTTEYSYRDPAYDPWRRSFLGFRKVAVREGSDAATTETTYWFGPCQGDNLGYCRDASDADRNLAVVGLPVRIDRVARNLANQVPAGWLWSQSLKYSNRQLFSTSGGSVWSAYANEVTTVLYDSNKPTSPGARVTPVTGGDPIEDSPAQPGRVVLTTRIEIDQHGDPVHIEENGRGPPADRTIQSTMSYHPCNAAWQCLMQDRVTSWTPEPGEVPLERRLRFQYTIFGELGEVDGLLDGIQPLERSHATGATVAPAPSSASTPGWKLLRRVWWDQVGNPASSWNAVGCVTTSFDRAYQQFPRLTSSHKGGCTASSLNTKYVFDRGLEEVIREIAPSGSTTTTTLDAFGRPIEVDVPLPDATPGTTIPAFRFTYVDGPTLSWRQLDTLSGPSAGQSGQSELVILNGLGNEVLAFERAFPAVGDGGQWIANNWSEYDFGGHLIRRYRPWYTNESPTVLATALTAPVLPATMGFSSYVYDVFGRLTVTLYDDSVQHVQQQTRYRPLAVDVFDENQAITIGTPKERYATTELDGFGRTIRHIEHTPLDTIVQEVERLATDEVSKITQKHTAGPEQIVRQLFYDSFGRLVRNDEPNSSTEAPVGGHRRSWRYAYDDEGRLVGTSDARGCGQNLFYDGLDRVVGADYSPCQQSQPAYSSPNWATGEGLEVAYRYDSYERNQVQADPGFTDSAAFALGQMVSVRDRGALTLLNYDNRGRVRRITRRVGAPDESLQPIGRRYTAHPYIARFRYDLADRLVVRTTGVDDPGLLVGGQSSEIMTYAGGDHITSIHSSYGPLVSRIEYDADGAPLKIVYGDSAATEATLTYDARHRLTRQTLKRDPLAAWSIATPTYSLPPPGTAVSLLADWRFLRDGVGSPITISDGAITGWPSYASAERRSIEYDPFYRVTKVSYVYSGSDRQVSPFDWEQRTGDVAPVPLREVGNRVGTRSFEYDWAGNTKRTADDRALNFDRSLGVIGEGGSIGPNQLRSADGVSANYDDAGNLTDMTVVRPGKCPVGTGSFCAQRYSYGWDEVGQLSRVRRWDYSGNTIPSSEPIYPQLPAAPATWDLSYAYSEGSRVRKSATDAAGNTKHTIDVFESLRLSKVAFNGATRNYDTSAGGTIIPYLSIGQVVVAPNVPSPSGSPIHVLLSLNDFLGSTAVVLDQETSEVVERVSEAPYGAVESDYRPERWGSFRDALRFTGKEEDIEAGLLYFGARYYHPRLGRWISPDPLAVHAGVGDLNPYAYVRGRTMALTDPVGLDGAPPNADDSGEQEIHVPGVRGPRGNEHDRGLPTTTPKPSGSVSTISRVGNLLGRFGAAMFKTWNRRAGKSAEAFAEVVEGLLGHSSLPTTVLSAAAIVPGAGGGALEARAAWRLGGSAAVKVGTAKAVQGALKVATTLIPKVLLQERMSFVYVLTNMATGKLIKWGATSRGSIRYAMSKLLGQGYRLDVVAWGSREEMWALERELTMKFGGPGNFESWARTLPPVLFPPSLQAVKAMIAARLWP